MTFCKYEFLSQKDWATYKSQITEDGEAVDCAIVEIGQLESGFAVDILWNDEPLESFSTKEVFPNPTGVHTYSGCDSLYLNRFCSFNPDSPHCKQ